ncbi:MAG: glycosyltransferase [Planctomycetaceae bacterium]|nr:glycosyltransferase [Planctomycetaceae bacterium]
MRTAHVITRLIIGGAQENTVFNVDDQHHLFGDEVCLITGPGVGPEGTLERFARQRGLDLRVLPELQRSINPFQDLRAYRAICGELQKYAPQIVHTHSSKAGILGRRAAFRLGIPAVHTIHGAAFHYGQFAPLFAAYRTAERMAARWCDHFISVCDAMTEQYLAAGIGRPDQYTTIYSGMDVDRFLNPDVSRNEMRQSLQIADEQVVIGKVARLFNLKGHHYLIEAAPQIVQAIPSVCFLLVGDGILKEQFEQRISQLGLTSHFRFAGLVPPDQVTNYVHAMDIVAHTSEWEGLARVLPQGLIAGKPVVSFAIDGAPEVCLPEETGLLVPPRDIAALAAALIRLAGDAELRNRLGETGRQRFTDQFRHETMTGRIREVYARILQSKQH